MIKSGVGVVQTPILAELYPPQRGMPLDKVWCWSRSPGSSLALEFDHERPSPIFFFSFVRNRAVTADDDKSQAYAVAPSVCGVLYRPVSHEVWYAMSKSNKVIPSREE